MTSFSLLSPLRYKPFPASAEDLGKLVYGGEAGTDGLLHIGFSYSDDITLLILDKGFREPLPEEEKALLESGRALPVKESETVQLPAGRYYFSQYPPLEGDSLKRLLLPWCGMAKHCYLRLFNEGPCHQVLQLFVPC